jgi:3'-phosphoadenosine 5'-phosphosulfate sulfotransferase (PAPS reductase)/FAD synthetase
LANEKSMKNIWSVSWGKDSFAGLLLTIENGLPLDEVVFFDTGMEFQAIYNLRDTFLPELEKRGIKYTELKPKEPFLYTMLERPCESKEKGKHNGYGWCGGRCRWGTTAKNKAIDDYCKDAHQYIGIAYDEEERHKKLSPNKSSPIYDAKMTEADCLQYVRGHGYGWQEDGVDLYDVLDRVSCWCCCNKNQKELENMYLHLPEYWERLKRIQERLDRPMKKWENKKYGEYGNVFDMEKVFEERHRMQEAHDGQA